MLGYLLCFLGLHFVLFPKEPCFLLDLVNKNLDFSLSCIAEAFGFYGILCFSDRLSSHWAEKQVSSETVIVHTGWGGKSSGLDLSAQE